MDDGVLNTTWQAQALRAEQGTACGEFTTLGMSQSWEYLPTVRAWAPGMWSTSAHDVPVSVSGWRRSSMAAWASSRVCATRDGGQPRRSWARLSLMA